VKQEASCLISYKSEHKYLKLKWYKKKVSPSHKS